MKFLKMLFEIAVVSAALIVVGGYVGKRYGNTASHVLAGSVCFIVGFACHKNDD